MKLWVQRVTSVTTKVRRLGYFVLFSKVLSRTPLSRLSLQQQILEEKSKNREALEEACRKLPVRRMKTELVTGELESPDAFSRYLKTATELGTLQELSGAIYNTKRGQILAALVSDSNIFELNIAQKYLLLKMILEKDYDYLHTAAICSIGNGSMEHEEFFSKLKETWRRKLNASTLKNARAYDELRRAIATKWGKKGSSRKYYFESIKAPRLEWLLDLGIIEFWNIQKNRVMFRDKLESLLDENTEDFSSRFVSYMKPQIKGSITLWQELPSREREKIAEKLLLQSFSLFQVSDAIRKISADQFLEYSVAVLSESGIVCEIEDLDSTLENFVKSRSDIYRYVKIVSDADRGYISKL